MNHNIQDSEGFMFSIFCSQFLLVFVPVTGTFCAMMVYSCFRKLSPDEVKIFPPLKEISVVNLYSSACLSFFEDCKNCKWKVGTC